MTNMPSSFGRIVIWDAHSRKPIFSNESGHKGVIQSIAFSSDSSMLVCQTAAQPHFAVYAMPSSAWVVCSIGTAVLEGM